MELSFGHSFENRSMTPDAMVAFTMACMSESAAIHLEFLCFPLRPEKGLSSKRFHNSDWIPCASKSH